MSIKEQVDYFINNFSTDLKLQYKGFRVLFWLALVLATLAGLFGNVDTALLLAVLSIAIANVANLKLVMINQGIVLDKIEDLKLNGLTTGNITIVSKGDINPHRFQRAGNVADE